MLTNYQRTLEIIWDVYRTKPLRGGNKNEISFMQNLLKAQLSALSIAALNGDYPQEEKLETFTDLQFLCHMLTKEEDYEDPLDNAA